jgi:hypothetical protein
VSSSVLFSASGNRQQTKGAEEKEQEVRVYSKLEAKPRLDESVPVCKGSPEDKTVAPYDRAARYKPLLHCIAERILEDSEKAEVAVGNCLLSAYESAPACEGAYRVWLVRLAVDESFAILHTIRAKKCRHTDKLTPAYWRPAADGCGETTCRESSNCLMQ